MGNSPTPPGLLERILLEVDKRIAQFARSGFLRNAVITQGGLTIRGGLLRLLAGTAGVELFYIGPVSPNAADGSPQQGWRIRRADGSTVLEMRDAFPTDDGGALNQALNWFDRSGGIVLADDTNSGQGIARPWMPLVAYPATNVDWPAIDSTSFVTVHRAKGPKQQPRLLVEVWGWNDTAGATGEVQVMVNGVQLGSTLTTGNATVDGLAFGPAAVSGAHMSTLTIEVQARVVSGGGSVQVGMQRIQGQQS